MIFSPDVSAEVVALQGGELQLVMALTSELATTVALDRRLTAPDRSGSDAVLVGGVRGRRSGGDGYRAGRAMAADIARVGPVCRECSGVAEARSTKDDAIGPRVRPRRESVRLIECVPNISEGRDQATIERVVGTVRSAPGVTLLDVKSDADHNRSVITYLGDPEAVLAATQALCREAFAALDMRTHRGAHPRMGAVDVVPFVPLRGVTTEEAVVLARRSGGVDRRAGRARVLLRRRRHQSRAAQPGRRAPRRVRGSRRPPRRSTLGARRRAGRVRSPLRGRRRRGPLPPGRLQRQPGHRRPRHRRPHRPRRAAAGRRLRVRQGHGSGARGPRAGTGLDEPDRLLAHAHPSGGRDGPVGGRPPRGRGRGVRADRPGALGGVRGALRHYLQLHEFSLEQIVETRLLEVAE